MPSGDPHTASARSSVDVQTLAAYARLADRYADEIAVTRSQADRDILTFLDNLPPGPQPVLDWGAGAGETAAILAGNAVRVEATDASPEMAAIAAGLGVSVRVEPFEALPPGPARFRGVWATVSLCHAPRDMVADLVALAAGTLVAGGLFHINMKAGEPGQPDGRDEFDRYFTYWEVDELTALLTERGLEVLYAADWIGPSLGRDGERYALALARHPDPALSPGPGTL